MSCYNYFDFVNETKDIVDLANCNGWTADGGTDGRTKEGGTDGRTQVIEMLRRI